MRRSELCLAFPLACSIGMLVAGCASRPTSAPVVDRAPMAAPEPKPPVVQAAPVLGAAATSAPAGYYQVKRGDTLYSIALDHGADHRDVAQWNRLENPDRIQAGQMLRVKPPEAEHEVRVGAARGAGAVESRPLESRSAESRPAESRPAESRPAESPPSVAAAKTQTGETKTEPKALRLPYSSENVAMLQKNDSGPGMPGAQTARSDPKTEASSQPASQPAVQPALQSTVQPTPKPAAPKPAAEVRDAESIEFIWPARGKLLAGFAEPTSKGVDIGGKPGDPVVAAAPGRVIYIGTGIRGYGKLIVIKHDNNFNSVYAHNREILVKQDQSVARGQKIAELGDTDADTPKLHFEIRKSGKPVDPAKYLPADRPS